MQFGEWVRIAIIQIEVTESMVLYEGGKRLPSDARKVCFVYSIFSTFYSLLFFTFFFSFSFLSLSTHCSNSFRYYVLHTTVDVSLRCLMISCPSHIHGYYSFYTRDQSQVISLLYHCFPPTILSVVGIQPTPTIYHSSHVQVCSIPLPSGRQKWVQSPYLLSK